MTGPNKNENENEKHADELAELVLRRAQLNAAYTDLQARLQGEAEPTNVVALLRDLSGQRTELARLDEEMLRLASHSTADPAVQSGTPSPPSPPEPPVPIAEDAPVDLTPLTLRFLVEGSVGAGVGTVLSKLGHQLGSRPQRATAREGSLVVDFHEFETNLFEDQAVVCQVIRLSGDVRPHLRRYLRSLVDSIIVVVDARSSVATRSLGHVSALLDEQREVPVELRPAVTVFANKSDVAGAVEADWITAALPVDSAVDVVATSRDQGFLFGFLQAANAGARRAQQRVADGLVRFRPLEFDGLLRLLAAEIERNGGASTRGLSPVPAPAPGPAPAAAPAPAPANGAWPVDPRSARTGTWRSAG